MLQDLLGAFAPQLKRTASLVANLTATSLCVTANTTPAPTADKSARKCQFPESAPATLCVIKAVRFLYTYIFPAGIPFPYPDASMPC